MKIVILALIILLIAIFLYWLVLKILFSEKDTYSRILTLQTDNVPLTCFVYEPTKKLKKTKKTPVILVHGIASNHRFFQLGKDQSFITTLTQAGYCVYAIDLRGFGASRKYARNDVSLNQLAEDSKKWIYAVLRDFYSSDIPNKKKKKVIWIGHSLGGIVLTLAFKKYPKLNKRVRKFVAISVPMSPPSPEHPAFLFAKKIPLMLKWIPLKLFALFTAPFVSPFQTAYDFLSTTTNTVGTKRLRRLLANAISDIPSLLMKELLHWVYTGTIHEVNAFSPLSQYITCRTLFITGRLDLVCDPWTLSQDVKLAATKKKKKKLVIASRKQGFSKDLCHTSIIHSDCARRELYPFILEFLSSKKES
ncbi:MAG: alpha/beta hydrolase [Candidatus Hydrogenedentota bacterium]|nr:MAG: alpha/beta hydrolase [Candidatus Hydrogenedentota bacterium]